MPSQRPLKLLILVVLLSACSIQQPTQTDLNPQANYWQQLGTTLDVNLASATTHPSLALDSSGNPVVGLWHEGGPSGGYLYVKRWNGTSWVQLGGSLIVSVQSGPPSMAVDSSNNPVVSWAEGFNVYVKRWNGSSWVGIGNIPTAIPYNPNLALDSSGSPVVSWEEGNGTSKSIYVYRYNPSFTNWLPVGTTLDVYTDRTASNSSLALDSSGNPVVSWDECYDTACADKDIYVKRWNGTNWVSMSGVDQLLDIIAANSARNPSLALDTAGNPVVSWSEAGNIYVKRWNGTSWVQLGTFLDVNTNQNANNPSLALDSAGNPVVSWEESDGTSANIYVKRWNGSAWVLVSTFLDANTNRDAQRPSLALDSLGNPVVGWDESDGTSSNVYVKKYITNSWQDLGGMLDVSGGQSATNSSIARKSNNNPVVAWDETDSTNGSRNVYVKEWNGSTWIRRGGTLDKVLGADAENPSVATRATGANIHVAWQENGNIYESLWSSGANFVTQGSANGGALDNNLSSEAITPSLAVRTDNFPVVAFAEDGNILVKRLVEINWVPIGAGFLDTTLANEAYKPSLALKSDDNPIVAWYEDNGTSFDIFVKEFNGSAWALLGGAIDKTVSKDAKDIVLAIRSDDKPVVAWEEDGNIYVKRWTGTSWISVGGVLDKTAGNEALRPSIDLRTDNNPVVSWQEWNGNSYDVWVKRWTGSTWALITNVTDKNTSRDAERPSLVLKSDNNPIVSWDEWDGLSENVYVKRF